MWTTRHSRALLQQRDHPGLHQRGLPRARGAVQRDARVRQDVVRQEPGDFSPPEEARPILGPVGLRAQEGIATLAHGAPSDSGRAEEPRQGRALHLDDRDASLAPALPAAPGPSSTSRPRPPRAPSPPCCRGERMPVEEAVEHVPVLPGLQRHAHQHRGLVVQLVLDDGGQVHGEHISQIPHPEQVVILGQQRLVQVLVGLSAAVEPQQRHIPAGIEGLRQLRPGSPSPAPRT